MIQEAIEEAIAKHTEEKIDPDPGMWGLRTMALNACSQRAKVDLFLVMSL